MRLQRVAASQRRQCGTYELEQPHLLRRILDRGSEESKDMKGELERGKTRVLGIEKERELTLYSARIEFATLGVALFH